MFEDKRINLNENNVDMATSLTKGIVGMVPVMGSIMAEVVGMIIPNQRIDRIAKYIELLEKKLEGIDQDILKLKIQDEYFIDLLEDSMLLASRAITEERKDYIATIIKNSITKNELNHLEDKRILNILSQINDGEIIILQSYALIGQEQRDYINTHSDILETPLVHMNSSVEEIDRKAIYQTFRQNLVALNLLIPKYIKPKKNELPEFDNKTGMIKATGYSVTSLGKLILRYLDLEVGF